ncbi:hypothetical protein BVRB_4g082690 [Beta vulgaris subsp. vulgaris]|nr:hypothetical protein BVRB_4g082690 [Beta vulgaris subsp. vulgaris]
MATILNKVTNLMLIVLASFLLYGLGINATLPRFKQETKEDGSLSFLVIGDWGRKGTFNQSLVATQMGIVGEKLDVDFIISTGDNFYEDGLTGVEDPAFKDSFTDIYTAPSLKERWYTVLGNHDYRGDVLAQFSPVLRKRDSRWFSLRSYIVYADIVDFFFVDTTPFQDKYFNDTDHTYDWRGVLPRETYLSNLLKFLTSGGGSKAWSGDVKPWNPEELKLYYDGQGFMSIQVTQTRVDVMAYDIFGNILHKWSRAKPGF